jgi:hypothetical protein
MTSTASLRWHGRRPALNRGGVGQLPALPPSKAAAAAGSAGEAANVEAELDALPGLDMRTDVLHNAPEWALAPLV